MSALGQKRTWPPAKIRCPLLPQKRTLVGATRDVRFVPIADMPTRSGQSTFDKKSSPSQGKIKGFFKQDCRQPSGYGKRTVLAARKQQNQK